MDKDLVVEHNGMILDMDNFDFNSIVDGDAEEEAIAKQTEVIEDEDIGDLVEEIEEVEDEIVEEEVEEESEEVEEVVEEVEDGDEEVDYESYEITLPSGESVVLAEIVKGYKSAAEIEAARKEVDTVRQEFENQAAGLKQHLELAKLEAERVIEDYNGFDWVTLSKEDPAAYVENREFLDKYKARREEILTAMKDIKAHEEVEAQKAADAAAREANSILARDITGWGPEMYRSLMDYAIENDYSQDFIVNCTDPSIFKLLHKAMNFEKGVQKVTAKVKKIGSPQKVAKANAKVTKTVVDPKKQAVLKKIEKTGDMRDAFNYLED